MSGQALSPIIDAARLLGISPRVHSYKIKTYGLTHPTWTKYREPGRKAG